VGVHGRDHPHLQVGGQAMTDYVVTELEFDEIIVLT
jgi:GTP:adenosylcobinamide-phosphate guanylyltransferase